MKSHILAIIVASLSLSSFIVQAAEEKLVVPPEFEALVKSPPSISGYPSESFKIPQKGGAMLSGEDFVSYIELDDGTNLRDKKYTFHSYSKKYQLEVSGEGYVREHYYRIRNPHSKSEKKSSRVVDKDSVLTIDAGLFTINWSSSNWIYFTADKITAKQATLSDYQKEIIKEKLTSE